MSICSLSPPLAWFALLGCDTDVPESWLAETTGRTVWGTKMVEQTALGVTVMSVGVLAVAVLCRGPDSQPNNRIRPWTLRAVAVVSLALMVHNSTGLPTLYRSVTTFEQAGNQLLFTVSAWLLTGVGTLLVLVGARAISELSRRCRAFSCVGAAFGLIAVGIVTTAVAIR